MQLSLVIPCYNEEGCIEEVVSSWIGEIRKRISNFEMVVVNDGSRDRTPEILAGLASRYPELCVLNQRNQGHGPALLNGYRAAGGEWVFHTDSDNQFVPQDFWKLWTLRNRSPFVMGNRSKRHDPWHRLLLTRITRWITFLLTGIRVRDINIPYKLIHRELLQRLLPAIPPNSLTPSILLAVGAHALAVPFLETDVQHLARKTGQTALRPLTLTRFCVRAFGQLLRFRVSFRPASLVG
ncbi:MAG TPA: glycosyltransferase family 2 protein [Acidimicrobiia bacterium]